MMPMILHRTCFKCGARISFCVVLTGDQANTWDRKYRNQEGSHA